MRYGAIIPAAGMSTRMKEFKQLMKIGEQGLLRRIIISLKRCGISDIVVVTGFRADDVVRETKDLEIAFIHNENFRENSMFDSIKLGLSFLNEKCDRLFISPTDVPLFSPSTVYALMEMDADIVIPTYLGREGHPVNIHAKLIPDLMKYDGMNGLRGAMGSLKTNIVHMEVDDPCCIVDADTPEEFQRLKNMYTLSLTHPETDIRLVRRETFVERRTILLLKIIDTIGSVRSACETIGISYSTGWKLINNAEEGLGYRIVDRRQGGKNGGAACLSEEAFRLIENYEKLEKAVSEYTEKCYRNFFD